jgi:Protein of unknown function (DUF3433)
MVVAETNRPKSQQPPMLAWDRNDQSEPIRPRTSHEAASHNDPESNEMETLSKFTDRSLLFPPSAYDASVGQSRSENHGEIHQIRRRGSASPSRASNFLRKISHRVSRVPKTPRTPKTPHFMSSNPKNDQYEHLDERDLEYEQDPVRVDISSLGGLGFQLMKVPDISVSQVPPSDNLAPHSGENETGNGDPVRSTSVGRGLGDGMVVGAQLRLDPSAAMARAKSVKQLSSSLSVKNEMQRAKSIRDLAQDLARRTRQVVAIDDVPLPGGAVDLSVLEGTERRRRATTSFDDISPNSRSTSTNTQSYFYPEDPNPPNWKPLTMSSPYILLLIILSLALAIIQEWLCRVSLRLEAHDDGILKFDRVTDISTWHFFVWKYLPTLIFVIYGVLWQIMDFEIKRLEPYYQLSQLSGSTAAKSLNLDHLSLWSYLVPFKAFRLRQWAVFYSAVGNLLTTSVCPSLQNPSVRFDENRNCNKAGCPKDQVNFYVRIAPAWSRALTSFLAITAVLATILFVQLRRKSGLLSDPKGIAGIAAMATKSHILNDFQGMDLATHREIHKQLQHRRYLLHKSSIWQGEYDKSNESKYEGGRNFESPHPMMLQLKAGIPFIFILAFCLLSVPILNFTNARVIPNTVPWLPILIATLIKIVWTTFEFDVRMMEPFYILSKGNAPPEMSLTLDYQGTVYGWFPIKALLNRHYILALVGFSSILADVLTVTVSSFSVNGASFIHGSNASAEDQTFKSFWGSVILSMVILFILILSAALVYALRRHPFLPRQPSTIAAVLAFIYASKMLYDFIDTERLGNKDMERRLKEKGKRYGLGWFKGRDGRYHCAIDEEPMRSRYVHGVSYTMAQEPWHGGGSGGVGGGGYDFMRYEHYV